jgi:hypothetical protein
MVFHFQLEHHPPWCIDEAPPRPPAAVIAAPLPLTIQVSYPREASQPPLREYINIVQRNGIHFWLFLYLTWIWLFSLRSNYCFPFALTTALFSGHSSLIEQVVGTIAPFFNF